MRRRSWRRRRPWGAIRWTLAVLAVYVAFVGWVTGNLWAVLGAAIVLAVLPRF